MYGNTKDPQQAKHFWKRRMELTDFRLWRLPDFRLYYKATVLKTVCTGTKTEIRPKEQDRNPKDNLCTYEHLIVDKGGKNIQWRKDSFYSKWFWKNWTAVFKTMKLEHFLTLYTKINSKWIKDLNGRSETIIFLEENIGRTLFDINHSKILNDHLAE